MRSTSKSPHYSLEAGLKDFDNLTIDGQLDEVAAEAKRKGTKKIVIADVGYFSGESMEPLIKGLRDRGLQVHGIVGGVATSEAIERFNGMGIPRNGIKCSRVFGNILDWIEARDFYPGFPASGRIHGTMMNGKWEPDEDFFVKTYSHGYSVAKFYAPPTTPYIHPYVDPESFHSWTSIPEAAAEAFGRERLDESIRIHEMLARLNGKHVTLGDLNFISHHPTGHPEPLQTPVVRRLWGTGQRVTRDELMQTPIIDVLRNHRRIAERSFLEK